MTYIRAGLGDLDRLPLEMMQLVLETAFPNNGLDGFSRVNRAARARSKEFAQHLQLSLAKPVHVTSHGEQSMKPLTQGEFETLVGCQNVIAALTPHAPIMTRAHLSDWFLQELRGYLLRASRDAHILCIQEFDGKLNQASATIWDAYANKKPVLTLQGANISTLPARIDALTSVRRLDMSACFFTSFEVIAKFPHLERLDVTFNDFETLEGAGRLPHLRALCMHSNERLDSLRGVEECTKLEKLILTGTLVDDLTPLIGLSTLKVLRVEDDVEIPPELQRSDLVIQRESDERVSWEDADPWHRLPDET